MKRRFCIRLIGFMAAMGVGCCVQAEVVYSNDFTGAEFIAPGRSVSTFYQNAAEIGGQLIPTNGAVSGLLIDLSALDLMNDDAVTMVKVTAVASRGSDWQTVGFATQTAWRHPDARDGQSFSPYFWMPQGQLRSGRGHFSGGTEWDADGDTPANMPLTVEMTFYKNTSSTNDDSVSVVLQGTTVFDQQVLEYGTTGGANLAGVQLVFGNDTNQYYDSVLVETIPEPATLGLISVFGASFLFVRRIMMV